MRPVDLVVSVVCSQSPIGLLCDTRFPLVYLNCGDNKILLELCSPPPLSSLFRPTQATVGFTRNSWLEWDLVSCSEVEE